MLLAGLHWCWASTLQGAETEHAMVLTRRLSVHGSTRATRYATANKIVTLKDKTHLAWLDSVSQAMIATYDHATKTWADAVKIGDGKDNHGGPALTCDSEGHLHVVFGPHADPFQHRRSARPNDSSQWVTLPNFGDQATYPSLVCDADDTLHIIYRGGPDPRKLLYQRRPRNGNWTTPRVLAQAPIKSGYTHYHAALTIAKTQALHISYDIYFAGAAKCAGHLVSSDRGDTWCLVDGSPLGLPVSPDSNAFFKRSDSQLKTVGVCCDSEGRPWITVTGPEVWHHDGKVWQCFEPAKRVASGIDARGLRGIGPPSIDSSGRLHLAAMLAGDVVMLVSEDRGETFTLRRVLRRHKRLPHVGLSLERPTGHHVVDAPMLLFSTGEKGPDCYGRGIYHEVHVLPAAR